MDEITSEIEYKRRKKIRSVRRHGVGYGKKWDKKEIEKQLRGL